MPKVTEAHLEARRRQILDAACLCFAREGFHKATMHAICREAGLSPGAVYRYFGGKEEIIEAMVERNAAQSAGLAEYARDSGDTSRVFEELASFFFGRVEGAEGLAVDVELWAEATHNDRVGRLLRRDFGGHRELLEEIVRRAQQRGEVNDELDPVAVARVMISFFSGLLLQKALEGGEVDVRKYAEVALSMVSGTFWRGENPEGGR